MEIKREHVIIIKENGLKSVVLNGGKILKLNDDQYDKLRKFIEELTNGSEEETLSDEDLRRLLSE